MRIRRIITNFSVAVITVMLCLLFAELGLRVYHSRHDISHEPSLSTYRELSDSGGSRLIPGTDVMYLFESTQRPVRIRINSLGCRGPELPTWDRDDRKRLLILGDSVAFGYGVAEESSFSALLDSLLASLYPPWRVVNASVEDIGIKDQRMIFQEIGDSIRPSLTIVMFYANDSRPPVGFGHEFLREDRLDKWFRMHPRLTASSHLARFIQFRYRLIMTRLKLYNSPVAIRFRWVEQWRDGRWRSDEQALRSLIESARFDWGAAWFGEGWQSIEKELDNIQKISSELNSQLAVCYLPVQVEAETSVEIESPQQMLADLCRERNIPFLDLLPVLRGKEKMFVDQCHLTEAAHALVASEIFIWIEHLLS